MPTARDQAYESAIGLNLTFPLLNREARGGAEAARLEEAAAESRLVLARQKLDVEFDESLLESETANQIYKLIFNEAQFASQVELAERKRFKQGDSALINVNMREQDAILARIRAIDALFDVEDRLLELKLLTNSWIRKY
jgi:outer membrane protein TolC